MSLKELIGKREEWSSMSIGEKYQTYSVFCHEMGEILKPKLKKITTRGIIVNPGITALDGQDFFYIISEYEEAIESEQDVQYWTITAGEDDEMWNAWVSEGIVGIKWSDIGDISQYDTDDDIRDALKEKYHHTGSANNDTLACFEFQRKMKKGDIVIAKKESDTILGYGEVTSDYIFDEERKTYKHVRKVDWKKTGKWKYEDEEVRGPATKTLTDITKYEDFVKEILNLINGNLNTSTMDNISKNTILYGPPGTGKTYQTVNKALEIIDRKFYQKNENNREILKKRFAELQDAGQIEFVTFHQSYGYEEFIEGIKAGTPDTDTIAYNLEDGIFKKISNEALENYNSIDNNSVDLLRLLEDFAQYVEEQINDEQTTEITSYRSGPTFITEVKRNSDGEVQSFITGGAAKNQSLTLSVIKRDYKDYLTGKIADFHDVKPSYKSERSSHGNANYYFGLYKTIKKFQDEQDHDYSFENGNLKNYVLVIDEINRGNISKIFGELITLIEESKRTGASDETTVRLSYSGEQFTIPSNLYIVGTMNTADRSIALLDTALRRRFDFEEMMPIYDIISDDVDGINVRNFLRKINERIEMIFDRDHVIGHAYFIDIQSKEELDHAMRNKIIPLLQEYFYDDWDKIQKILGDYVEQRKALGDGIEIKDENRFIISSKYDHQSVLGFSDDDMDEDGKRYRINDNFTAQVYKKLYDGKQSENPEEIENDVEE